MAGSNPAKRRSTPTPPEHPQPHQVMSTTRMKTLRHLRAAERSPAAAAVGRHEVFAQARLAMRLSGLETLTNLIKSSAVEPTAPAPRARSRCNVPNSASLMVGAFSAFAVTAAPPFWPPWCVFRCGPPPGCPPVPAPRRRPLRRVWCWFQIGGKKLVEHPFQHDKIN